MYQKTGIFIYFAILSVNLISFSSGTGYTWTSPVLPTLYENSTDNPLSRPVTTAEASWISALINFGALIGTFMAGYLSNKIGKKRTLLVFSIPMVVSQLMCAFATTVEVYLIARFLFGIGNGSTYALVPNFVAEVSDVKNRGLFSGFLSLMSSTGMIYIYVIGPFVSIQVLCLLTIIPSLIFMLTFGLFVPETPYYYVNNKNDKMALDSLNKFRKASTTNLEKELESIKCFIEATKNNKGSFRDLFKSRVSIKALSIACILMFFQQFSGINAMLGYMQSIFESSRTGIPAEYSVIIVGFIQLATRLSTSLLSDRLGRKKLLIFSGAGCCLSLASLAIYFNLKYDFNLDFDISVIAWLPLTSLIIYTIALNSGLAIVPWILLGELFAANIKSAACTISSFLCMFFGIFTFFLYPYLSEAFGIASSFWIFSISCALSILFSALFVPETKGKTFMEIQNILENSNSKK